LTTPAAGRVFLGVRVRPRGKRLAHRRLPVRFLREHFAHFFSNPAPRAHLYLAPSTCTGISVEYG